MSEDAEILESCRITASNWHAEQLSQQSDRFTVFLTIHFYLSQVMAIFWQKQTNLHNKNKTTGGTKADRICFFLGYNKIYCASN